MLHIPSLSPLVSFTHLSFASLIVPTSISAHLSKSRVHLKNIPLSVSYGHVLGF